VKNSGYVWRRDDNAIRFLGRVRFRMKKTLVHPILVPLIFYFSWTILG
jgi:hypothetical protein